MFDLNQSIKQLAARASGGWLARRIHQAELEDHLHCVVEEKVRSGVDEQLAFEFARRQLGEAVAVRTELRRARRSQAKWPSVGLAIVILVTLAGIWWRESEVSQQAASNVLAVVVMPLKWLGLLL
ncbi:MAG: hypothetical protein JNL67_06370 [Planctomycetaceae bacterium]|nr:hypothetical protein [Planctomycetaceae bacterium]